MASKTTKTTATKRTRKQSKVARKPKDLEAQIAKLSKQVSELKSALAAKSGQRGKLEPQSAQSEIRKEASRLPQRSEVIPADDASVPSYELKKVRAVNQHSASMWSANSADSDSGFFSGLLDRARMQWLMRDWKGLAELDVSAMLNHPQRSKIALLVASACWQTADAQRAKEFVIHARDYGCSDGLVIRMLAAGVHANLARIANLQNRAALAAKHSTESSSLLGAGDLASPLDRESPELLLAPQPEVAYTCSVPITVDGGKAQNLMMNAENSGRFAVEGSEIAFELDGNTPLYFVSNETGSFDKVPIKNQISLKPGCLYVLSGRICVDGGVAPVVWIFQYSGGKKTHSQSINTTNGHFSGSMQMHSNTDSVCVGVRFGGKGHWRPQDSHFEIHAESEADAIRRIEKELIASKNEQKQAAKNSMRQIESSVRLQHYLGADIMLPQMHNWMISPDFGVLLVELIEENAYDAVIEFGSGTSTLLAAKALGRMAATRANHLQVPLFSFDHLGEYLDKTKRRLMAAKLADGVDLIHAPLAPWVSSDRTEFSYYDCREALLRLKSQLPEAGARILVVVDGPPAATGPKARFPALPMLLETMGDSNQYHFLLDDMIREDEKQVANAWLEILRLKDLPCKTTDYKNLEKQALLISVN